MTNNMTTILITGFGPFPSAPFNPTGPLVKRLARLRRPALADARIVTHVFPTGYAAVDRELPALIARHRPDVLLMFGLAARTPHLRVETRARNAVALLVDASGLSPRGRTIVAAAPAARAIPAPTQKLLTAVRRARVPAALSRDAGRYLCNYLCWRAAELTGQAGGPRLSAFIHVPNIARGARRPGRRRKLTLDDLTRAGANALIALIAAARR